MKEHRRITLAVALGSMIATATGTAAQAPPDPNDVVVPRPHPTVTKSDQHRIVGKVVDVDRGRGVLKLQTADEGVVEVKGPTMTVNAARVGETVSVPRTRGNYPSASPR